MISTFTRRGVLGIMAAGLVLLVGVILLSQSEASTNGNDAGDVKAVAPSGQSRDLRQELEAVDALPPDDPKTIQRRQRLLIEAMQRFSQASRVQFRVSGVVVDQSGEPLDGVTMHYSISWPVGWDNNQRVSGNEQVDGEFTLEPGVQGQRLTLHVKKEGYYPERRSFAANHLDAQTSHDLLAGKLPERNVTEIRDLKIQMQKIGELTELARQRTQLSFSADGSGKVFDFTKATDKVVGALVRVADVTDAEQLPRQAAYFVADVTEDGTIPATEVQYRDILVTAGGPGKAPDNLRLVMTNPDSGFIVFYSDDQISGYDSAARRMVRAPDEGYEQMLELNPDFVSRGHLFYFKAGNLYGRGKLDRPRMSHDGKTFEMWIEWQIQPNGSRNLETLTWRR